MDCPGYDTNLRCSGHGRCMTMSEYASNLDDIVLMHSTTYTNNWDSYNSWGCVCDPSYTGYDCSIRQCPFGDDPGTDNSAREVQLIDCLCKDVGIDLVSSVLFYPLRNFSSLLFSFLLFSFLLFSSLFFSFLSFSSLLFPSLLFPSLLFSSLCFSSPSSLSPPSFSSPSFPPPYPSPPY